MAYITINNTEIALIDNPIVDYVGEITLNYINRGQRVSRVLNVNTSSGMIIIEPGWFNDTGEVEVKFINGLTEVPATFMITNVLDKDDCLKLCGSCGGCASRCSCNIDIDNCCKDIPIIKALGEANARCIGTLKTTVKTLSNDIGEVRGDNILIHSKLSTISGELSKVDTLSNDVSGLTGRVKGIEESQTNLNDKFDNLEQLTCGYKNEQETTFSYLKTKVSEYNTLSNTLGALKNNYNVTENKVKIIEENTKDLKKYEDKVDNIDDLLKGYNKLIVDVNKANDNLEYYSKEYKQIKNEYREVNTYLNQELPIKLNKFALDVQKVNDSFETYSNSITSEVSVFKNLVNSQVKTLETKVASAGTDATKALTWVNNNKDKFSELSDWKSAFISTYELDKTKQTETNNSLSENVEKFRSELNDTKLDFRTIKTSFNNYDCKVSEILQSNASIDTKYSETLQDISNMNKEIEEIKEKYCKYNEKLTDIKTFMQDMTKWKDVGGKTLDGISESEIQALVTAFRHLINK